MATTTTFLFSQTIFLQLLKLITVSKNELSALLEAEAGLLICWKPNQQCQSSEV